MRSRRFGSCTLAALALSVGAFGCGKVADKVQEKAVEKAIEAQSGGTASVDLAHGGAQVTSKDGKTQAAWGKSSRVPDDFPKQVPIYPGSTVISSSTDNTKKSKHMVVLQTGDPADKVVDYYKGELKAFRVEQDTEIGGWHTMKLVDDKTAQLDVLLTFGSTPGKPPQTYVTVVTEAL